MYTTIFYIVAFVFGITKGIINLKTKSIKDSYFYNKMTAKTYNFIRWVIICIYILIFIILLYWRISMH